MNRHVCAGGDVRCISYCGLRPSTEIEDNLFTTREHFSRKPVNDDLSYPKFHLHFTFRNLSFGEDKSNVGR